MAEITKVTTPMVPRENTGNRFKPISDQALDTRDISKVQKPADDRNVQDREASGQQLRDNMGRAMVQPLFRETTELVHTIQRMVSLLQLGISTADIVGTNPIRDMLQSLFVNPDQLLEQLQQQEQSAVLFRGEGFDSLRAVLEKFPDNPRVQQALVQVLKSFEQHVNTQNSLKTILYNCRNILDYMFTQDRAQFEQYLDGLESMILPGGEQMDAPVTGVAQQQEAAQQLAAEQEIPADGGVPIPEAMEQLEAQEARQAPETAVLHTDDQKEIAQILKGNLLPLLGEVVVKYHQNERIRDIVMVIIHNIVRVDKGTEEELLGAIERLCSELRKVARIPDNYEDTLGEALLRSVTRSRNAQNDVMTKLAAVISQTLHSENANPAALRQSENLLLSLLQNQSSMMNVLHFVLPMQTPEGQMFAELYVDPDAEESKGRSGDKEHGRKVFLSVDSEGYGSFEFSFWQVEDRVDFSLWCPQVLVSSLSSMRRTIGDLMQVHGFSLSGFRVEEFVRPQTIAQVFPKLLTRKVGIDVRI